MENLNKRSIIDMARGAIKERADYEMTRVVENILDPNTSATAARKITITLTLKSDDMLEAADGQTTISYEAYYTSGTQDIESVSNGVNYWGEIEINFIPMEAQVVPK